LHDALPISRAGGAPLSLGRRRLGRGPVGHRRPGGRRAAGCALRRAHRPRADRDRRCGRAGEGMMPAATLAAGRRVWLCDLDGTLVDSAPAHAAAFRAALAEYAPSLLGSFRYESYVGATTRALVTALGARPDVAGLRVRPMQRLYSVDLGAGG